MRLRDCQCDKPECPRVRAARARSRSRSARSSSTRQRDGARARRRRSSGGARRCAHAQDAARKAARPILFTQALAIAALIGLLVSVAGRLTLPALSFA